MDERREQPTMEPANALNVADEKSAVSDVGSQGQLGKFKDAMALLEAYNNLEAEFTRKCQLLKSLQQDKIDKENAQKTDTSQEKEDLTECKEISIGFVPVDISFVGTMAKSSFNAI